MTSPPGCIALQAYTSVINVEYFEAWWLIIGFFVGLIIGIVIAFLCLKLCLSSWLKKKRQDEEQHIQYSKLNERDQYTRDKKSIRKSLKKRLKEERKKARAGGGEQANVGEPTVLVALELDDLSVVSTGNGSGSLVNAMVQTTEEAGENELLKLDVETADEIEEEMRLQKIIALAQLLRLYLNKLAQADRISESIYEILVEFIHSGAKNIRSRLEAEIADRRDELSSGPDQQKQLDELSSQKNTILDSLLRTEQSSVVDRMAREAKMSDEEAEAMMLALSADLANWERALGEQQAMQRARLAERLLRRQQLLAATQKGTVEAREDVEGQLAAKEQQMDWAQREMNVNDKLRQEILDGYRTDVVRLHNAHEQAVMAQQRGLSERLKQQREQRLKDLSAKQLLKEREFLRRVDQVTETGDFVHAFGTLIDQQANERELVIKDLDEQEARALVGAREDLGRERATHINELEDQFLDKLRHQASLSPSDIDNLVAIHERELLEWKRLKAMEKKMMRVKLEERLAEKRFNIDAEEEKSRAEEKALRDRQILTLKKTLNLQMEVTDEEKDRVMKEHEQNVEALSNQLSLSRSRQQRQMEQRLAERRAKLADLKLQKANAELERGPKAAPAISKEFDARIDSAEREVTASRARDLEQMRERLAAETAEALAAQERQLGALLARMQLGQARRQNIIAKQDQTIAQLEAQLQKKLDEAGDDLEANDRRLDLDQLLQQHQNQMAHLTDSLEHNRSQQEAMLTERLRRKRAKKEHVMTTEMNEEAGEEQRRLERAGISRTGQMLMEAALEQRHRGAIEDVEKEMMVELQRDKEAMNRDLEQELQRALAEQQKNFLAQLATVAELDEEEVKKVAQSATRASGVEGKEARRFVRNFRDSFRRTNSTMHEEDDGEPRRQRVVSFPDEESPYSDRLKMRPRSSKSSRSPRPILKEELAEEDF